jgi:CDP-diacylglycerol--glycerol-3-phosphate 3-phosphatidyltransferase
MNLPNRLTLGRLIVAVALFVVLEMIRQASLGDDNGVLKPWLGTLAYIGFVLFLIAAFTDFLDGYLARRRKITSDFGRIADPFADKVLICGSLVFLSATGDNIEGIIPPWVVVIILAREFLVTGLRGYMESRGMSFGAKASGKIKMFLQSVLVGGALFILGPGQGEPRLRFLVLLIMIATVCITVYSGWVYIRAAGKVFSDSGPDPERTDASRPAPPPGVREEASEKRDKPA